MTEKCLVQVVKNENNPQTIFNTEAYHSYAGIPEQQKLYKAYEIANNNYKNNPQTIFN